MGYLGDELFRFLSFTREPGSVIKGCTVDSDEMAYY